MRRLDGGTRVCDGCGDLEFGTCVRCGDHGAEVSRVIDGDLRPVCYLCKSV